MTTPTFDINAAIQALREGKDLTGKDGILTPLIKQLTEAALVAELDGLWLTLIRLIVKTVKPLKRLKAPLATSSSTRSETERAPSNLN